MGEDITEKFDQNDIAATKGWAVVAYLGWFLLFPLLINKDSQFTKFHCNQGLVLALAGTLVSIITKVFIQMQILGLVGVILAGLINLAAIIAICILSIIGIVDASKGRARKMPFIENIHLIDNIKL